MRKKIQTNEEIQVEQQINEEEETQEQVEEDTQENQNSDKENDAVQAKIEKVGMLSIPDINLQDKVVYEGTDLSVLAKGIGHFTNTSICNGNVGLASHNSGGSGDEFKNLKNVSLGSKIYYKTEYASKTYKVEIIKEISDEDWSYLNETNDNRITLLTCVSGKPNKRLCVQGIEVL